MSGQLIVLDRSGRNKKNYPLQTGLATIGSDLSCDICLVLPTNRLHHAPVRPHHATVVIRGNQAVVRNVSSGETLVNGAAVSVAALRHGDVVSVAGRRLRWQYDRPPPPPPPPLPHALCGGRVSRGGGRGGRGGRGGERRASAGSARRALPALPAAVALALELSSRASMPSSTTSGGKQVAVVQPQRRDTSEQNNVEQNAASNQQKNTRTRISKTEAVDHSSSSNVPENEKMRRKTVSKTSTDTLTTKATQWIESRKTTPRKAVQTTSKNARKTIGVLRSTPVRMTALRKAATPAARITSTYSAKKAPSAQKPKLAKIEAPLKIDHTKQVALMLITGHTPKSKQISPRSSSNKKRPSHLVQKYSPLKTPKSQKKTDNRRSKEKLNVGTPGSDMSRRSKRSSGRQSVPAIAIDMNAQQSITQERDASTLSVLRSPQLLNPKKSAMKDPSVKRHTRKTESIKFDLSNLENYSQNESDISITEASKENNFLEDSASEEDINLYFSDASAQSSPQKLSRSQKILENTLGSAITLSSPMCSSATTPESPRARKSLRSHLMLQKVMESTGNKSTFRDSRRLTKPLSDQGENTSAINNKTHTLSPSSRRNLETYSIVDLVSVDSESVPSGSNYNSAGSINSSAVAFGTPQNNSVRRTRSTIDPILLGSSTPYVIKTTKSFSFDSQQESGIRSSPRNISDMSTRTASSKKSKSLVTPENTRPISINSTKISRPSKSRSRINDSDLELILSQLSADETEDSSPRTSKRVTKSMVRSNLTENSTQVDYHMTESTFNNGDNSAQTGYITPEDTHSPEQAGTPVLSIQNLLDSSATSLNSTKLDNETRPSIRAKRHTIGGNPTVASGSSRAAIKSRSLNFSSRNTVRRLIRDSDEREPSAGQRDEENVTPKSTVTLVQEDVKNKHSTAKKPQSKRSIIDNLDDSDLVKQLFSSPVKRKLSQSMTEFSRKHLLDDDVGVLGKRRTRSTIAVGLTPDNSVLLDHTEAYTPEVFVSPLGTPDNSPNLLGIKRLFQHNSVKNDLSNVKGVKRLLRSPRTRKSVKNDLRNVSGVKTIFAKSPRNSLSDVRGVKNMFGAIPENDLRDVSGVKTLFQRQRKARPPMNDLTDVTGVKKLFQRKSPRNDLRNVSGVKRTLGIRSPINDLRDTRGVRRMFKQKEHHNDLNDISGVQQLFNDSRSNRDVSDSESLFDELVGKPRIKATYSKSFHNKSVKKAKKQRRAKSADIPLDIITNNVEEWLNQELQKRVHRPGSHTSHSVNINTTVKGKKSVGNVSGKSSVNNTGNVSSRVSRSANRTASKMSPQRKPAELSLPIKKRSLVESSSENRNKSTLKLPIKKRALVHSTPMKGRHNYTANATELGQVSPIAAESKANMPPMEPSERMRTQLVESAKPKKSVTKKNIIKDTSVKVSPRKTRGRGKDENINEPSNTRTRKARASQVLNTKKRRSSLVITKKTPTVSGTLASTRRTRKQINEPKETSPESPEHIPVKRATRRMVQEVKTNNKPQSKQNLKVRTSIVVSKLSLKRKPQPAKRTRDKNTATEVVQANEQLPNKAVANTRHKRKTKEAPMENATNTLATRSRKMAAVIDEPVLKSKNKHNTVTKKNKTNSPEPQIKRSRKKVALEVQEQEMPKKRTRGTVKQAEDFVEPVVKKSRKTVTQIIEEDRPSANKRRKVAAQSSLQNPTTSVEKTNVTKNRRQQKVELVVESKSTNVGEPVQPLPKRGRRAGTYNKTVVPEEGTKRTTAAPKVTKSKEEDVVETKRSRNTKAPQETVAKPRKGKSSKQTETSVVKGKDMTTAGKRSRTQVEVRTTQSRSRGGAAGGHKRRLEEDPAPGEETKRSRRMMAATSAADSEAPSTKRVTRRRP